MNEEYSIIRQDFFSKDQIAFWEITKAIDEIDKNLREIETALNIGNAESSDKFLPQF